MTISELIELLQEIKEKEGDLGVAYVYNDGGYPHDGRGICRGSRSSTYPVRRQGRRTLVTKEEENHESSEHDNHTS